EFRSRSLGSGVIISKDGYIITNNHVIENATEITVRLSTEKEYKAKVVGRDPKTDIALIQIQNSGDVPLARLGDSDRLEVGEWVMAIGNPFGLGHTVTAGIVSAKGRVIGQGPYDEFIQTDASINPGNSGGPLFNMRGEVVGINTAIVATGQGIGFAIPVNVAKTVVPQLRERGKVTRGWLGVLVQKVTPELAESFGLKKEEGALVANVVEGGPADKAGIKRGDVVVQFNGKRIHEMNELPRLVAATPPGTEVQVRLLREGKELALRLKVGELKEERAAAAGRERAGVEKGLGLTVQELTPEMAEHFGLKEAKGVIVTEVEPGSPGEQGGVVQGDIIKEVNRRSIRSLADYRDAIQGVRKGSRVLMLVTRGEHAIFLTLRVQ
ncbi:MAG: DegQ family serine endoprotease, partial [Deltaproteobacteria bacterium]|nr:DegQ family serine endoprotease [Deltaproteobacteria bacterium]